MRGEMVDRQVQAPSAYDELNRRTCFLCSYPKESIALGAPKRAGGTERFCQSPFALFPSVLRSVCLRSNKRHPSSCLSCRSSLFVCSHISIALFRSHPHHFARFETSHLFSKFAASNISRFSNTAPIARMASNGDSEQEAKDGMDRKQEVAGWQENVVRRRR